MPTKKHIGRYLITACVSVCCACSSNDEALREAFRHPAAEFRPMPFWHINGEMTSQGIREALAGAKTLSGFGGVAVLPVRNTRPQYLSDDYFARYGDILRLSQQQCTEVILYDDIDFPSGTAGGRLRELYPQYTRKHLTKDEHIFDGPAVVSLPCPSPEEYVLMATSAMNDATREVVDLQGFVNNGRLEWQAPEGKWRVMFFSCRLNVHPLVDYMQPEAVAQVIRMTYDEYAARFSNYFGWLIKKTFFDDVGFVHQEETWTPAITAVFEQKYSRNPALYYPALYYDIGPETGAARVAFYDIRAELMAEGYVRQVAEWSAQYGMQSMGHPPENYSPNTAVVNGDILKYYRHVQIPLLDAIFFYGRGVHGFKQVSSAADLGDKPVVGAELYGAFPANTDSTMLYRVAMEAMARGVNFIVPHGMWYDTNPEKIHIPPLISHENPLLGRCLPRYSDYVARCCMMLQGGRRVADIALLSPIHAIEAESYINRDKDATRPWRTDDTTFLPRAHWLPPHVQPLRLSRLLTNELRRDFTYVHPENLYDGKIIIEGNALILNNLHNRQRFRLLIIPGGEVISAKALQAIRSYYESGGKLLATGVLPSRSSEFGHDADVRRDVQAIFGDTSATDLYHTNEHGGIAAFLPEPDAVSLEAMVNRMAVAADVVFEIPPLPRQMKGFVNYIHKQKEEKDIYFLTNSTDSAIQGTLRLRGRLQPELWNPYSGTTAPIDDIRYESSGEHEYTLIPLTMSAISSMFIVSP